MIYTKILTVVRQWKISTFSKYSTMTTMAFFLKTHTHTHTSFRTPKFQYGGSVALGKLSKRERV